VTLPVGLDIGADTVSAARTASWLWRGLMRMMAGMRETESKWEARVTAWRASGQTAPAFCAGKDFTPGGLRYWASRLHRTEAEAAKGKVRLARVVRGRGPKEGVETPILIELGNARVGVRRGFDAETLRAVFQVLGGGR
jgi:hypothetical protein